MSKAGLIASLFFNYKWLITNNKSPELLNPNEASKTDSYDKINMNELQLISINKVSKLLGIRYDSVKRLIKTGKIGYVKIDQRTKIPYKNLLDFINTKNVATHASDNGIISPEEIQNQIDSLISEYSKE